MENVYDHTTLKAPHPARSAKLSNVGLSSVPESETVWEHAVSKRVSGLFGIFWRRIHLYFQ
ncbi:hypothetical protein T11_13650 [Trichinella zimbabwensis]|uniref:Uncharacterized protein n=1 Tax=Trichinella zimbabwensis TaxID=268475 RepID=A0A0V1G7Q6_9BILA|nr:hypothetical protein T11_13650 [Trichinella zimbabwensis]